MRILSLGLSHNTAEVALREKLAVSSEGLGDLNRAFHADLRVNEIVILSTCNRVEYYAVGEELTFDVLEELVAEHSRISREEISAAMYRLVGMQVVSHLFRVASGLDSMVLGEAQILGQVTQAYEAAQQAGSVGKLLSRLFQMAIHAGKRVRTETHIGENATSIPSVAVRQVKKLCPHMSDLRIVVLGAGEMAESSVEALRRSGARHFHVVSRTLSSACKLADRWQGEASTMAALIDVLRGSDVLITSSSAPHTLVNKGLVEKVMQSRSDQPLVIIDIAVPRDVEPDVGELANVHLFDIDALDRGLEEATESRRRAIPQVEAILDEIYLDFKQFLDAQIVVPLIAKVHEKAEMIRQTEVAKTLRHLNGLAEKDQERITALTQSIVKKILHHPTVHLLEASGRADVELHLETARSLFGLNEIHEQDNGSDLS